uniref:RNase III domain-containing protein n=1 Tax=Solanum lycopersicum TaxID=4081 RepID=A0A3Q7EB49_SOLLC
MLSDHSKLKLCIPIGKIFEGITTKKCLQKFHLESLGKLGDSFLKCDVSRQLFKNYESQHEGLLRIKKIQSFPILHFATLDVLVKYEIYA